MRHQAYLLAVLLCLLAPSTVLAQLFTQSQPAFGSGPFFTMPGTLGNAPTASNTLMLASPSLTPNVLTPTPIVITPLLPSGLNVFTNTFVTPGSLAGPFGPTISQSGTPLSASLPASLALQTIPLRLTPVTNKSHHHPPVHHHVVHHATVHHTPHK
jgi:hypothetical protein